MLSSFLRIGEQYLPPCFALTDTSSPELPHSLSFKLSQIFAILFEVSSGCPGTDWHSLSLNLDLVNNAKSSSSYPAHPLPPVLDFRGPLQVKCTCQVINGSTRIIIYPCLDWNPLWRQTSYFYAPWQDIHGTLQFTIPLLIKVRSYLTKQCFKALHNFCLGNFSELFSWFLG